MKKNKSLIYIILIIVVAFITMLPMFFNDYVNGHDTKFHVSNIESITEQYESGNFSHKILGNMGRGFGYGTGLFYPPLPHVSSSIINLVINNTFASIEIVYFVGLIISGISMYFLSKKISGNEDIGLLSAVIYMLFPYHISNIYIRDAQNESILFAFLPLIISGLYELFKNDNKKKFYILFIGGYVLSMLSHLTMMVYFTVIICIFLLFNYKKTLKNITPLIVSSLIILAITSFFWVPLLEQKIFGNYRVFQDGVMVQGTWGNGLNPLDYINLTVNWKDEKVKYFIDAITLILLTCTLFNFRKIENKFYKYILIFGIISFVLSSILFPWDIFPKSFRIMQFPWRFVGFFSISVSLLAPLSINSFKDTRAISFILCVLIVLLSQPLLHFFSNEKIDLKNLEYEVGEGSQHEYFPISLYDNLDYYKNRTDEILIIEDINETSIDVLNDSISKLEFRVDTESVVKLELPRIYYFGYNVSDMKGNTYKIYESSNGFIEVVLPSGNYILEYTGSGISKACNVISILFTFAYLGICFKKY